MMHPYYVCQFWVSTMHLAVYWVCYFIQSSKLACKVKCHFSHFVDEETWVLQCLYLENWPIWILRVSGMRLYVIQVYALQLNV